MIGHDEGVVEDNDGCPTHYRHSTPPIIEAWIELHRQDEGVDTKSPVLTCSQWATFRQLVRDNATDAAIDSWASGVGTSFASWWSTWMVPNGHARLTRRRVSIKALCLDPG